MNTRSVVLLVATVSTATVAGFYGTFSWLVMPALRRMGAQAGAAAMQSINRLAPAPWLVVGVLAAGGACAASTALAVARRESLALTVGGTAAYLASVALTLAFHVPRNDLLEARGAAYWDTYARAWTNMNQVRTVCALIAAICLGLAASGSSGAEAG